MKFKNFGKIGSMKTLKKMKPVNRNKRGNIIGGQI